MDIKSFIIGAAVVIAAILLYNGFKALGNHSREFSSLKRENRDLIQQVNELKSDTAQYRKDVRTYMQQAGIDNWYINNKFDEYETVRNR